MPFIAYAGARPLAGLGHVCSRLFNEMISQSDSEWWRDDHGPTNVGAMVINLSQNCIEVGWTTLKNHKIFMSWPDPVNK